MIKKFYYNYIYSVYSFFKNIYLFRKELFHFRNWDYSYTLEMFQRALKELSKGIASPYRDNSLEIEKINRVVELLDMIIADQYCSDEEYAGISYKDHDKLENDVWDELLDILKGPNWDEVDKYLNTHPFEGSISEAIYNAQQKVYQGKSMRTWWS